MTDDRDPVREAFERRYELRPLYFDDLDRYYTGECQDKWDDGLQKYRAGRADATAELREQVKRYGETYFGDEATAALLESIG